MRRSRILLMSALPCLLLSAHAAASHFKVLHDFQREDGGAPFDELVPGNDGNFYGTTFSAGPSNAGTFFSISPQGSFHRLASFSMPQGAGPYGGVTLGKDGYFYGTAVYGGANGTGTVFRLTSTGQLSLLHSFSAPDGSYSNKDGANPSARLTLGTDGNWYGSTAYGGPHNAGTLFRITPDGALTVLHSFNAISSINASNDGGAHPMTALTLASDGNFYGVTLYGGANGTGTLFRLTPSGTLTTLHDFQAMGGPTGPGTDGAYPLSAPVQSGDLLYGTTSWMGASNAGTVYSFNPGTGQYQLIYSFPGFDTISWISNGGVLPSGRLLMAAGGVLYGTTENGGANGYGTLFSLTLPSSPQLLYSFDLGASINGYVGTNTSGSTPMSGLLEDPGENFLIGMTSAGGKSGLGTIFTLTLDPPSGTTARRAGVRSER